MGEGRPNGGFKILSDLLGVLIPHHCKVVVCVEMGNLLRELCTLTGVDDYRCR
jgi:hypothetical protein